MAAPLILKRSVLAAKIEATHGTMETPTASDAAFNVFNARLQPQIEAASRDGQGASLSKLTRVPGAQGAVCEFDIELTGGATPPAWALVFLPACGLGNTAGVFAPESKPPEAAGAKSETITIWRYVDGKVRKMYGAMGTAQFRFTAGQVIIVHFTFTGIWGGVADATLLAPTYPTVAPLRMTDASWAIGADTPVAAELVLDLGNDIYLRQHVSADNATGYHSAVIRDRNPIVTVTQETLLAATYDPETCFTDRTELALAWEAGTTGNKVAFAAPKAQVVSPQEAELNGLAADQIQFALNRNAAAGDDELTLTFS